MGQADRPQAPVVNVRLIVTDRSDKSVSDLRKEELEVREAGAQRPIVSLTRSTGPVTYALVMDNSGSFKDWLKGCIEAAKAIVNSNNPDDQTLIERFVDSNQIQKVQEFTSDKPKLLDALNTLIIGKGQSAVIDALYVAAEHTAKQQTSNDGRRALVIFTDGEDRNSYYSEDQLLKLLRESDVQVFVMGLVARLDKDQGLLRPSTRGKAELLLTRIAKESGGRVFFPKDEETFIAALEQIIYDLHNQYVVAFEQSAKPGKKGFREVEIKIINSPGRERLKAVTRPGYVVKAEAKK